LHLRIESCRLDYILKSICVVTCIVIKYGKCSPVHRLSRVLISRLLEVFKGFFVVLESHVASSENVKRVSLRLVFLLRFLNVL
jgi:hypothetical protein